ncbi:MAG: RNA 2',3'-cyclic phosphodiesterase [Bacteroidota bacterium]|nr:RNA 2',3'-cyclic phosphodiesterase [Bacteroidota bacterium]
MDEKLHRSFIAIFPTSHVLEKLLSIQGELKKITGTSDRGKDGNGKIRWEKENKFHFTIQFWGDQTEEWINTIHQEISKECSVIKKFHIHITKVGCFPNRYSPKIFWIGSEVNENPELISFSSTLHAITKQAGFEPETKPFHPHITIGRGKGKIQSALIQKLETVTFHPLEFQCSELRIMKSMLAQSGSTYTTLFTIPLQPQETYGRR